VTFPDASTWTASGPTIKSPVAITQTAIAAAFGTTGVSIIAGAYTQTDSTTAAGTVATAYGSLIGANTFATAVNAVTITNGYNVYVKAPVQGANVTGTNLWALGADSLNVNGIGNFTGSITSSGNIFAGTGSSLGFVNQSKIASITDAVIRFQNSGGTQTFTMSFPAVSMLQLGALDAAAPSAQTLQAQSVVAGNGNTAGATFTIAGSKSNGSGGGDVVFQTTLSSASSGVQNTLAAAMTLKGGAQSVVLNSAAIATNATDGFLYITTCAGTPTGTPTTFTGRVPIIFDTTNSQFWIYTGGAWKQAKTPAGAALVTWQ